MSFTSQAFAIFLALVLAAYYFLPRRGQNFLLLVASYVFYGWWDWRFLGLIVFSTVVDFYCGRYVDLTRNPSASPSSRKWAVFLSCAVNLGLLGVFKYLGFFVDSTVHLLAAFGVEVQAAQLNIILPVGISFYTFQTMSYTIDVYRGHVGSCDDLPDFMLYVSFFPQLVAGPIERGRDLLPQVRTKRPVSMEMFSSGLALALVGYFKKTVLADNMAAIANVTYASRGPGGVAVLLGSYAFAFQIYCDFSGYTDIARGISRMLGFNLRLNFRMPYLAVNPSDFWSRWHVSLSSWLRDYLYIPLGGNRRGAARTLGNLMITMLLGGLWHGASWTFVLWGAYHGVLLVAFRIARRGRSGLPSWAASPGLRFFGAALLYFHLTLVGWVIFRAADLHQLGGLLGELFADFRWTPGCGMMLLQVAAVAVPLMAFQVYQNFTGRLEPWTSWPVLVRVAWYLLLFYGMVYFGSPHTYSFIYFQF